MCFDANKRDTKRMFNRKDKLVVAYKIVTSDYQSVAYGGGRNAKVYALDSLVDSKSKVKRGKKIMAEGIYVYLDKPNSEVLRSNEKVIKVVFLASDVIGVNRDMARWMGYGTNKLACVRKVKVVQHL